MNFGFIAAFALYLGSWQGTMDKDSEEVTIWTNQTFPCAVVLWTTWMSDKHPVETVERSGGVCGGSGVTEMSRQCSASNPWYLENNSNQQYSTDKFIPTAGGRGWDGYSYQSHLQHLWASVHLPCYLLSHFSCRLSASKQLIPFLPAIYSLIYSRSPQNNIPLPFWTRRYHDYNLLSELYKTTI